jgi:hypothetical protein
MTFGGDTRENRQPTVKPGRRNEYTRINSKENEKAERKNGQALSAIRVSAYVNLGKGSQ